MTTTSLAAEQAATQALAAAGAFETAFASVVPPPLIAANRAELAAATQANIFGQYNNLIAQLEAQYGEMWAQDSSAMYSYASQSATAAQVTHFTTAPAVANPAAALTQAATAAAPNSIIGQLQLFLQQTIAQLQKFANPFLASKGATINSAMKELWFLLTGQTVLPTNLGTVLAGYANYASFFYNTEGLPYFSVGMGNFGVQMAKSAGALGGAGPAAAAIPKSVPALGGALGGGAHTAGSVSGSIGSAGSVGKLSVPAAWSGASGSGKPCQRGTGQHRQRRSGGLREPRKPPRWHAPGGYGRCRRARLRASVRLQAHHHGPATGGRVTATREKRWHAPAATKLSPPAVLFFRTSENARALSAAGFLPPQRLSCSLAYAAGQQCLQSPAGVSTTHFCR